MLKVVRNSSEPKIHHVERGLLLLEQLLVKESNNDHRINCVIEVSLIDFHHKLRITYKDLNEMIGEHLVPQVEFTRRRIKELFEDLIWTEERRSGRVVDW